ncbi:MAG: hypothetical protein ACRD2G_11260 [Terriglobia bacterium]
MRFSVILPVPNEAALIGETLADIQPQCAAYHKLIAEDGGSRNATLKLARSCGDRVRAVPAAELRR